jgi:hypothetical protein
MVPTTPGEIPVPTQQCRGRHEQVIATVASDDLRNRADHRPVCPVKTSTPRRPTQHHDLVAKDHDHSLVRGLTATADEDPQHNAEGKVEEPKGHHRILPNSHHARARAAIRVLAPFRAERRNVANDRISTRDLREEARKRGARAIIEIADQMRANLCDWGLAAGSRA